MLLPRLIFVMVRPLFAVLLSLAAVIGVAASNIIMNLLIGYFAVATSAYTSVHPHIAVHGSWSKAAAADAVARIRGLDALVVRAAPALHFPRTLTFAGVNVLGELCDAAKTPQENCKEDRSAKGASRVYAFDVTNQRRAEVQVRGITIENGDTPADLRKLMSGDTDFQRLVTERDSGGNELPVAFIAEDTLISEMVGNFLIDPGSLRDSYQRYYRMLGVLRLGAMTSGAPLLVLGMEQARKLAPPSVPEVNVIEVRLSDALAAERIATAIGGALGPGARVETWIARERPAFQFLNATWVMVFTVMLSICFVVAISIYSTVTLSVLRNRWKIALLGVVGMTPARIAAIFLGFGVVVALTGIVFGTALGYHASRIIGGTLYEKVLKVSYDRFAETMTLGPAIWMAAATLAIFVVSVVLPARRAVSIRPAVALRGQA